MVDGFDCPIQEPACNRKLAYMDKDHWHSIKEGVAVRFVVAIHMETYEIIWLSKSYPGGASEINIIEEELFPLFVANEKVLGDRLFRYEGRVITSEAYQCEKTRSVNTLRQSVERRINVVRSWKISRHRWRGTGNGDWGLSLAYHRTCIEVICKLSNIYWGNKL